VRDFPYTIERGRARAGLAEIPEVGWTLVASVLIASAAGLCLLHPGLARAADAAHQSATASNDWTGGYVGGHVGYSRGTTANRIPDADPVGLSNTFGSIYGGLQGGYNYVFPSRFLFGIEADMSFPNFLEDGGIATRATTRSLVTDEIDYVGTLRARFGHTFGQFLIYGTGGFAWSQARWIETPGIAGDSDKVVRTRPGWAIGAGAEAPLASGWSTRLEYLYNNFGSVTAAFPSGSRYESVFDVHMLRLGLNYRIGALESQALSGKPVDAWTTAPDNWNIHGQLTLIGQGYPAFHSPYQGTNSLFGGNQFKNTTSATAFIGMRPWENTEFYVNPELMQGFGLSDTFGVAGFPNGEAQKSNFPVPRVDLARVFVRQTFGFGGEQETIEDGPNQLAGKQDISRLTVTAGRFAALDFLDGNVYSHDPRRDFLNWNMYCCGSYDITMDKVGYTWGAFADFNQKNWAFRAGYFLVPTVSNVSTYDMHVPDRGEYAAELELRYSLLSEPGKFRLMSWLNRAVAGSYTEAISLPPTSLNFPDITLTRRVRDNYGFIVNVEQAITGDLGLFSRATWGAGQTEKIGWTDCDRSFAIGAVLKGTSWGLPEDRIGVGSTVEALSPEARAYFAAGGLGILIGDGQLNYRQEKVFETYYAHSIDKWWTISFDFQFIANPGYNADRGPVSIFAGRRHAEF
jgi:high affinity Mn2+ porin